MSVPAPDYSFCYLKLFPDLDVCLLHVLINDKLSPTAPVPGNMTNNMPRSNAKSVLTNDYRLTLETLNQFKNGAISSHTNKPDKVGNSPVKKRTHTATSSLAKVINMETVDQAHSSSASKPELRR